MSRTKTLFILGVIITKFPQIGQAVVANAVVANAVTCSPCLHREVL